MIARAESGQARDDMADSTPPRSRAASPSFTSRWPTKRASTLKVEAADAAPVRGNRELVSQALANLVDNAIKYAAPPAGGADGAARDRGDARRRGRPLLLDVSPTTGRVFPQADRGRVVERFVRLDRAAREPGSAWA